MRTHTIPITAPIIEVLAERPIAVTGAGVSSWT